MDPFLQYPIRRTVVTICSLIAGGILPNKFPAQYSDLVLAYCVILALAAVFWPYLVRVADRHVTWRFAPRRTGSAQPQIARAAEAATIRRISLSPDEERACKAMLLDLDAILAGEAIDLNAKLVGAANQPSELRAFLPMISPLMDEARGIYEKLARFQREHEYQLRLIDIELFNAVGNAAGMTQNLVSPLSDVRRVVAELGPEPPENVMPLIQQAAQPVVIANGIFLSAVNGLRSQILTARRQIDA